MALNSAVTRRRRRDRSRPGAAGAGRGHCRHTDMNPVLLKPDERHRRAGHHSRQGAIGNMDAARLSRLQAASRCEAVLASYARLQAQLRHRDRRRRGLARGDQSARRRHRQHGFRRSGRLPGGAGRRHRPRRRVRASGRHAGAAVGERAGARDAASSSTAFAATWPAATRARLARSDTPASRCSACCPICTACSWMPRTRISREAAARRQARCDGCGCIVPVLPRISNHTDFDPLRTASAGRSALRRYRRRRPAADLIILPGSKNVRADLAWLRAQAGRSICSAICATAAR